MPRAIYGAANLMFAKNYFNHVSLLKQLFKDVLKNGRIEKFGKYHQKRQCKECFFRFLTCNSTIKREIFLYEKKYITVFLALIFPNNFQWFKKWLGRSKDLLRVGVIFETCYFFIIISNLKLTVVLTSVQQNISLVILIEH